MIFPKVLSAYPHFKGVFVETSISDQARKLCHVDFIELRNGRKGHIMFCSYSNINTKEPLDNHVLTFQKFLKFSSAWADKIVEWLSLNWTFDASNDSFLQNHWTHSWMNYLHIQFHSSVSYRFEQKLEKVCSCQLNPSFFPSSMVWVTATSRACLADNVIANKTINKWLYSHELWQLRHSVVRDGQRPPWRLCDSAANSPLLITTVYKIWNTTFCGNISSYSG